MSRSTVTAAQAWGTAIREAREALGLTRGALAELVDVDRSAVRQWELGLTAPRAETQPRIVDALDLDVVAIYGAMASKATA